LEAQMSKEQVTADILALPAAERLELVEQIWDSLAADPGSVPVPDWHREELDRRLARHRVDPSQVLGWKGVKHRLTAPTRKRRKS
jgi:putative addiction module component (TIGR02574 family)